MKYLVMECHEGYAILMDEDSRFVKAANLRYSVGQTVTDPVLMEVDERRSGITRSVVFRTAAAAACVLFCSAFGMRYYSTNIRTDSMVTIGSDVKIEMELNSRGKVLRVHSDTEEGKELLRHYEAKNKDKALAANEIICLQKEYGYVSDGDTVELYVSAEDNESYSECKAELEQKLADLPLNVEVREIEEIGTKRKPHETPAEPPKPAHDEGKKDPEPPKPPVEDGRKPDTPAAPPEAPVHDDKPKPADPPKHDEVQPPAPPQPPADAETPAKPDPAAAAPVHDKPEPPTPKHVPPHLHEEKVGEPVEGDVPPVPEPVRAESDDVPVKPLP